MKPQEPAGIGRAERTLAFMFIAIIVVSVLAFLAVLLAPTFGVRNYAGPLWSFVIALPLMGLPLAILLMIGVLIAGVRRRRQQS
ncbi:hypothetical protein C5C31_05210 [Rathayibacter rathayi]|uniref:hypothetical protein n=1 Tax=Rathayibacter rathayi TaxID=33887 RepID=UPI000CE8D950|nr:hypothetical protein [Rathayibacter rathayi]PPG70540.1 hypothetical protein C5C02_04275 [Rathayibacter rathayi]PPG76707.1 hypothetical protein C5C23_07025 [Rathayibacter rathayi]PPG90730.1 hypothetical protein C5C47_01060 [Rathayibacter rathayi]PPG98777.1 hypothetical protein C5C00_01790 [Rathayibacter rathayi]PPH25238.1 hypothetical protein C5C31_05210 [Rathayibacter rathayi]